MRVGLALSSHPKRARAQTGRSGLIESGTQPMSWHRPRSASDTRTWPCLAGSPAGAAAIFFTALSFTHNTPCATCSRKESRVTKGRMIKPFGPHSCGSSVDRTRMRRRNGAFLGGFGLKLLCCGARLPGGLKGYIPSAIFFLVCDIFLFHGFFVSADWSPGQHYAGLIRMYTELLRATVMGGENFGFTSC